MIHRIHWISASVGIACLGLMGTGCSDSSPQREAEAVAVARENVRRNGLEGRIRVAEGSLGARWPVAAWGEPAGGYELVAANISSAAVLELMPAAAALLRTGGRLVASGFMAARAEEIEADARELNLKLRVGLHTGEIELRGDQIGGIAVHIAARVMEQGADGGVFVSGTVKDLVVGSGIVFDGRGKHALKGVPGEWPIFSVTSARSSA